MFPENSLKQVLQAELEPQNSCEKLETTAVVARADNPSTQEAEEGGSLSSKSAWFQDSQGYTGKLVLKN